MAAAREKKVMFAMAPAHTQTDRIPVLTFLIPTAAWDYMRTGLGHDFGLVKLGIPLRVIIGRCRDHTYGRAMLQEAVGAGKAVDVSEVDVGFDDPNKKAN
jgi:hypothetical protein